MAKVKKCWTFSCLATLCCVHVLVGKSDVQDFHAGLLLDVWSPAPSVLLFNSLQLKSAEQLKYRKGFLVELLSQVCCIQLLMFALWLGAGDIIFDMRCQV